jgi:hypothetical protein
MRFYLFRGEGCEYEEFIDMGDGVWEVSEWHRSRVGRGRKGIEGGWCAVGGLADRVGRIQGSLYIVDEVVVKEGY